MAKLLNKEEVKRIEELAELRDFTKRQEESYVWTYFPTNEGSYIPLDDNPICVPIIRDTLGVSDEVSNETIAEQMGDTKLCLSFPINEEKREAYPVGPTAYRSVLSRIGASCPALTALADTRIRTEVCPQDKASVLNTLKKYTKGDSLLLIGDELILADLSDDYIRLPFSQILSITEEVLNKTYEDVRFVDSLVSHASTSVVFRFRDTEIDDNIFDAFSIAGIDVSGFTAHIKVITSDVGLSGVNIYPFIQSGSGKRYPIGLPVKLEHIGKADMEKYRENLSSVFASYKDIEARLEKMKNTKINNPADCLYNVGKKVTLPDKALKEIYEETDIEFPYSCTGIDIFQKLFCVLDNYVTEEKCDDIRAMQLHENITRVCFYTLKNYDYPVV